MSSNRLVIGILAMGAVVIIGMAVYIFTHFNSMSWIQEIILIAVALIILFAIMAVLVIIGRSTSKK